MTTTDHPITRTELREEIDRALQPYATKEDLANLETRLVKEYGTHLRWMIGLQLAGLAAIAAVLRLLS